MRPFKVLAVLAVFVAIALGAWWFMQGRSTQSAFNQIVPTGPAACPEDPNNLAGIEGWAPGAGKAEQAGQNLSNTTNSMSGALGGEASTPSPAAKGCIGLRADLAARFDWIDEKSKLLPTDGYDPAARSQTLTDADAVFAFVRDNIHTDAYAGAMRGASGTLQSFAGSPADKAVLLAALLSAKQVPVRFVHAPLTAADSTSALAAAQAKPHPPAQRALDDAFRSLGIDPSAARAAAATMRARVESKADAVIAGAKTPTDALLATLQQKSIALPSSDAKTLAQWKLNLRDHWWIQAQENGQWVDLDPTLPSAAPRAHLGGAPGDPADALPDSAQATITVRLEAQRGAGAAKQDAVLIERAVKMSDAYAVPIIVTIGDRNVGSSKLAQARNFTPSITAGDDEQSGDAFTADSLALVTLFIETKMADGSTHTQRRIVLDRRTAGGGSIDPAWTGERTAYALTGVYDLLPIAGELDPGFTGQKEIGGMHALRGFMAYAAAGGNGRQMPPPAPEPYPLQALRFFEYDALVRHRLEAQDATLHFSFDRPQIALEHRSLANRNGKLFGITQFDIVDNAMTASGASGARANFTRGYVDTYAEQHLFSMPNDGGTIALFDAAKQGGIPTSVYQGEKYGGTAIAPQRAVALNGENRAGWWQVDPSTGNLVGRMDDGAGQELAEYAMARANDWSTLYSMMQFYGDFFRCVAGAVEAPLSGMSGAAAQNWFTQCAGAAICSYLEALAAGEAFSRWGSDAEALLYNILDLSIPGTKDSWPPSGGAACSGMFKSPLY